MGPTGIEQIGYSNHYPGALAEHLALQELLLLPVPDSLESDLAALTEPLAVGEHAVGLSGLEPGQPGLVVGCGPVGLAVIAALKGRGHGPVLAADFSPTRRRLAEAFGADDVIDPAEVSPHERWTELGIPRTITERIAAAIMGTEVEAPVIFEAVGVPGMLQSLIADAPPHSRIVVVGVCMHTDAIEPFMAVTKEIEFRFSFGYDPSRIRGHPGPPRRGRPRGRPPHHLDGRPRRRAGRLRHAAHPGCARQDSGAPLVRNEPCHDHR